MIKILNKNLNSPIIIKEEHKFYNIIIENPNFLSYLIIEINNLMQNEDSELSFFKDDKEISLLKTGLFIDNIFSLDLNDKKNVNSLYKVLNSDFLNSSLISDFADLNESLTKFLSNLTRNTPVALDSEPLDLVLLFKAIDLKFKKDDSNILYNILSFIKVILMFKKIEVVFFVNIQSFLSDSDIQLLKKELLLMEIQMINFSGRNINKIEMCEEKNIVITEDLNILE